MLAIHNIIIISSVWEHLLASIVDYLIKVYADKHTAII